MNNGIFLTEKQEHNIPWQILKTIFGLHASFIHYVPVCVVSRTFVWTVLWFQTLVVN